MAEALPGRATHHVETESETSMTKSRLARAAGVLIAVGLGVFLLASLAGCAGSGSSPSVAATAKGYLPAARSQLTTTAPQGKLLLVQTANIASTTSTPVWSYLFGDPKTSVIYAVMVQNGKPSPAMRYGVASLTATEWAAVPTADAWKVDSDAAYQKAVAAYPKGASAPYAMGFVTYVPKTATATIDPFVWSVAFNPEGGPGVTPTTVKVNATTGAASVSK